MATEICTSDWDLGKRRRISSDSDASMIISKVGDDLLREILIRLPDPKSACRCKLVCRLWRSVISHRTFNGRFVSHRQIMSPNDLKSIVLTFLPPGVVEDRDALKVLDCNRDLVLCGFWDEGNDDQKHARSYLVCNLFTNQWSALPLAPKKLVRYGFSVPRLVCEPQPSSSSSGSRRFRVVCIYQQLDLSSISIRLDVFCSESGEWTKDALVRRRHLKFDTRSVSSCNGELFWPYDERRHGTAVTSVAVFNPFRLDLPPTSLDVSAFLAKPRWRWSLALCQDAVHVIVQESKEVVPVRLSVWRLEKKDDGRNSWRKVCEGLVNKTSKCYYNPFLHPQRPEIVFFNRPDRLKAHKVVLCCDLRREEEPEFFAKLEGFPDSCHFRVFQPRISGRFTPIPNFEKLRCMHNGN